MGLYGVKFGSYHSYDTWELIPKNRPTPTPATVKTNLVDVFGSNGVVDLSEAVTGEPMYNNRTITAIYTTLKDRSEWDALYTDIQNKIHGQRLQITRDEDPLFYYMGRCSVSSWESFERTAEITITCDCDPFKLFIYDSADGFSWSDLSYGKKTGTFSNDQTGTITGGSSSTYSKYIMVPVYWKGYYPEITLTKVGTSQVNVYVGSASSSNLGLSLTDACTNKTFTIKKKLANGITTGSVTVRYASYLSSTTDDTVTFTVHARPRSL